MASHEERIHLNSSSSLLINHRTREGEGWQEMKWLGPKKRWKWSLRREETTGLEIIICTGLREIHSCSCLTVPSGPVCILLDQIYHLFFSLPCMFVKGRRGAKSNQPQITHPWERIEQQMGIGGSRTINQTSCGTENRIHEILMKCKLLIHGLRSPFYGWD